MNGKKEERNTEDFPQRRGVGGMIEVLVLLGPFWSRRVVLFYSLDREKKEEVLLFVFALYLRSFAQRSIGIDLDHRRAIIIAPKAFVMLTPRFGIKHHLPTHQL
jgi:hypothetical protein